MEPITDEWRLYEDGKDYKNRINLYSNVDKNERFYCGDQWNGVVSNGLPTPVFNIFKRVINYFISAILSQAVKMQFIPENIAEDSEDEADVMIQEIGKLISDYSLTLWEKLKMDSNMRQALLDAALSGDACAYNFWDANKETGQNIAGVPILGDIDIEMVDNVNVFFGNPNDARVETQPYILISFRQLVSQLKKEAKDNGVRQEEIDRIVGDADYEYQAGDMSKYELDDTKTSGKTTALCKFWRDDSGNIWWNKSTKHTVIRKDVDMGIKKYPTAWTNWDKRKNSYHGQAVGTGLIPNQIFINKMFAMVMLNLMHTAFPKVVYDSNYIKAWSNQIGEAIPVTSGMDVGQVAKYLQPGEMSSQVMGVIDAAINYTKDLVGASDAALGDVKPDNYSAIIAIQQAAAIPLETIKANLYQFVEDIGNIWLEFMAAKYGVRKVTVVRNGVRQVREFDFSLLKELKFNLKIDVGPSSYWSEIASMQTLDNLLQNEKIDFLQYLERVPEGIIPKKQELIEQIQQQMELQMQQQQMMLAQQAQAGMMASGM